MTILLNLPELAWSINPKLGTPKWDELFGWQAGGARRLRRRRPAGLRQRLSARRRAVVLFARPAGHLAAGGQRPSQRVRLSRPPDRQAADDQIVFVRKPIKDAPVVVDPPEAVQIPGVPGRFHAQIPRPHCPPGNDYDCPQPGPHQPADDKESHDPTMKIIDRYVLASFIKNYLISFMVLIGLYIAMDMVFNFANLTQTNSKETLSLVQMVWDIFDFYFFQAFVFFLCTCRGSSRWWRRPSPSCTQPVQRTDGLAGRRHTAFPRGPADHHRWGDFQPGVAAAGSGNSHPADDSQVDPRSWRRAHDHHPRVSGADDAGRPQRPVPGRHVFARDHPAAGRCAGRDRARRESETDRPSLCRRRGLEQRLGPLGPDQRPQGAHGSGPAVCAAWRRRCKATPATSPPSRSTQRRQEIRAASADLEADGHAGKSQVVWPIKPPAHAAPALTQPLANVVLLLLAIPAVLTREPGRLKSAAMKCMILTALCMGSIFLTYQFAGALPRPDWILFWPALMTWIPIFVFGPWAMYSLERVKS